MTPAESPHTRPPGYRFMLGVVIFLGVLIILAIGALIVGLVTGAGRHRPAPARPAVAGTPYQVALPAAPGSRIAGAALNGNRLTVRLENAGGGEVVVLDASTGRVLGRVSLAPSAP